MTTHLPHSRRRFWGLASLMGLLGLVVVVGTARQIEPAWRSATSATMAQKTTEHPVRRATRTGNASNERKTALSGSSGQSIKPENDTAAADESRRRLFWVLFLSDVRRNPLGFSK
jgi:hypothetical protein